jgi:hypothetical protein
MCDGGDRRQGFAAEAERTDGEQVVDRVQLGGRMSLNSQRHLRRRNPFTVVGDLDQASPSPFDAHPDRVRPGVQGVLHQLLDDRCRPLDHFPGGNRRGNFRRQDLYRHGTAPRLADYSAAPTRTG